MAMDLSLSIMDTSGHAEVKFGEDVRVNWNDTTRGERKLIKALVKTARECGLSPRAVKNEKVVDAPAALPGLLRNHDGALALMGAPDAIAALAKRLVEDELALGRIVLIAQDDGTWKIAKKGEFDPAKAKKVTTAAPVVGG